MSAVLIAGATGAVGSQLLDLLLDDDEITSVVSIGRRPGGRAHSKLDERVVDFGALPTLPALDMAFSCLGTTIKVAGSQAGFRAVDHDAVMAVAEAGRAAGASTFVHVTAIGASPGSRIFYSRVKGETERDVSAVGFERVVAVRPSMIDAERAEARPAEQLSLRAMRAVGPLLGRFRPNPACDIAAAMLVAARRPGPGTEVVPAGAISALAADLGGSAYR